MDSNVAQNELMLVAATILWCRLSWLNKPNRLHLEQFVYLHLNTRLK